VLVFQHNIQHEGEALIEGRKYTIRTDVMYISTNFGCGAKYFSFDLLTSLGTNMSNKF
jgi:hypothetical protein